MKVYINGFVIDSDTRLEYVPNPKRVGFKAHARYEQYQECTTIEDYMDSCSEEIKYAKPDLKYDEEKGFLKLYVGDDHVNAKD